MKRALPALVSLGALTLGLAALGACVSAVDDGAATSAAALSQYDNVEAHGTQVTSNTTPSATESASTHLVGFLKTRTAAATAKQFLTVKRWTEITNADGSKPFTAAAVTSDKTAADGTRTVLANVTIQDTMQISVKVVAKPLAALALAADAGADAEVDAGASASASADAEVDITLVNTTGYTHWLLGQVLEPGKLTMTTKIVPHDTGTIVDATMKVKLDAAEDQAPAFCDSVKSVFAWLDATTPHE